MPDQGRDMHIVEDDDGNKIGAEYYDKDQNLTHEAKWDKKGNVTKVTDADGNDVPIRGRKGKSSKAEISRPTVTARVNDDLSTRRVTPEGGIQTSVTQNRKGRGLK
jgi:YD repeat-containing protein